MLQTTLLTGISSSRFRRCPVEEEARVLYSKFFLLLSCFLLVWSLHRPFSKFGSESFSGCIQSLVAGVRYPNSYTEAMGIQESHRVYVHLALKECLAGLNIARVVGFHLLFFMHHPLKKKGFWKEGFSGNRFQKWSESGFTKSRGIFFFKRPPAEESFWEGLKSTQILKTKIFWIFQIKRILKLL